MGSVWLSIWLLEATTIGVLLNDFTLFLAVMGFGVLGLMDDLWGNRETGGLVGHLSELVRNRHVTTGAVKAGGGIVVAFLVAYLLMSYPGLWPADRGTRAVLLLTWTLLVALSANSINLLDVRPSRAIKGASILMLTAYVLSLLFPSVVLVSCGKGFLNPTGNPGPLLEVLLLPTIAYSLFDFRSKAMMGDVGSNALGALVGWYAMVALSLPGQGITVVLLLAFHIWTEKYSLTEFIKRHPVLDWLDRLGTGRPPEIPSTPEDACIENFTFGSHGSPSEQRD